MYKAKNEKNFVHTLKEMLTGWSVESAILIDVFICRLQDQNEFWLRARWAVHASVSYWFAACVRLCSE